jgi:hypothetical protein
VNATDANTTARLMLSNPSKIWSISNLAAPYSGNDFAIADESVAQVCLFINGSGNVGIGTTSTGSNKLAVEGTIAARRVLVTQAANWPDYVFDSTYILSPLERVQEFISKHKHLPDVPSSATVEKEGIDLGNNQAILLRKIEELTLYIIEMNKSIGQQQEQIKSLKLMLETANKRQCGHKSGF